MEHRVVEKVSEYIKVVLIDLSAVNLVEDLHEDECIKNHCIVKAVVNCPQFIGASELNSEDKTPSEKKHRQNYYLEETLPKNISPHDWRDNIFVLRVGLPLNDVFFRRLSG